MCAKLFNTSNKLKPNIGERRTAGEYAHDRNDGNGVVDFSSVCKKNQWSGTARKGRSGDYKSKWWCKWGSKSCLGVVLDDARVKRTVRTWIAALWMKWRDSGTADNNVYSPENRKRIWNMHKISSSKGHSALSLSLFMVLWTKRLRLCREALSIWRKAAAWSSCGCWHSVRTFCCDVSGGGKQLCL